MTIERTYRCNLCRKMIEDTKGEFQGVGLRWANTGKREAIQLVAVRTVEHHLCDECCDDLREQLVRSSIPGDTP